MTLGSRLGNLLSPQTDQQVAPTDGAKIAIQGDQQYAGDVDVTYTGSRTQRQPRSEIMEAEEEEGRPPYIHAMLAGGIGGTTGDMLMHSLDTVKTRQQGDPHFPPKYASMSSTYATIFRQEGFRRGLYSGVTPALLGSFPGTVIFFGTYEWSKRFLLETGVPGWFSYLSAGFLADLAAAPIYVPSEVLKTRLQLQGRYNNPFFQSGYNYRSTLHAARTIAKQEGFSALFYGYKATLWRDLPFSALQFAFYEQELRWAKQYKGSRDVGAPLEILTGATAGGLAGALTCPLDVVKTRIQTQVNPSSSSSSSTSSPKPSTSQHQHQHQHQHQQLQNSTSTSNRPTKLSSASPPKARPISTSSPSTAAPKPGSVLLDTSSVLTGIKLIYKTEGVAGWFRGVGPRAVWTSVQSGTMLFCYQRLLRVFENWDEGRNEGEGVV